MENEENHGNPKKYEWNHLKSLKYNCYIMNVLIILVIKLLLFGVLIHRITEKCPIKKPIGRESHISKANAIFIVS